MDFKKIKECGDATAWYDVTNWKSRTVGEFIQEVLSEYPKDWGRIDIGHWNSTGENFKGECEYVRGKIREEMPKDALDIEIKSIVANGGWGMMDYVINWKFQ